MASTRCEVRAPLFRMKVPSAGTTARDDHSLTTLLEAGVGQWRRWDRRQRVVDRDPEPAVEQAAVCRDLGLPLVAERDDPDELPASSADATDGPIRRAQLRHAILHALSGLSADDRLLLVLRFSDERPVRDIAAALREWIRDAAQYDDLTFLVMKVT